MSVPVTMIITILVTWFVQSKANIPELDVVSYHLTIEPNIQQKSLKGTVVVKFRIDKTAPQVTFSSGNLKIDKLTGNHIVGYTNRDGSLIIELAKRSQVENEIIIEYHGSPTRGLWFNSQHDYAYTIFSTSQWMICNDSPADKALFDLNILVPEDKICVASGDLVSRITKNGKVAYTFQQNYESPSYTYGFTIGNFNQAQDSIGPTQLQYYAQDYSSDQLLNIFKETPEVISFFERKSGVKYNQSTYSQILIGDYYQEMSGFSTLKHTYGQLVLNDSMETNLISHELAHQWWGNRVTCSSWSHFWLNEAVATFMSAAYNEVRFGKEAYMANINAYRQVYQTVKENGNDKPLVFDQWINPTKDDRNLVYFKGAYVLHLLREKMGDQAFWDAIRSYTIRYYGKSVNTQEFQHAMEASSGLDLQDFFNEWVYLVRN